MLTWQGLELCLMLAVTTRARGLNFLQFLRFCVFYWLCLPWALFCMAVSCWSSGYNPSWEFHMAVRDEESVTVYNLPIHIQPLGILCASTAFSSFCSCTDSLLLPSLHLPSCRMSFSWGHWAPATGSCAHLQAPRQNRDATRPEIREMLFLSLV